MATNSGVNVIDLCFVRTFINFLTAVVTTSVAKQKVWAIPEEQRGPLMIRCVIGLIGFTSMVYGV